MACEVLIDDGEIGDYELIVVNDASTDDTGDIADRMAAADPRIRVVHHPKNRKLGGAMKTGFATATGDLVLYTDADLPVRHVRALTRRAADARVRRRHRQRLPLRPHRRGVAAGRLHVRLQRADQARCSASGCATSTSPSSCAGAASSTTSNCSSEGSFIDAELVIRATRLGFEIIQFGVDYFPRTRGESTLSSPAVIRTIVREMLQLAQGARGHREAAARRRNSRRETAGRTPGSAGPSENLGW